MQKSLFHPLAAAAAFVALLIAGSPAWADCAALDGEIRTALKAHDTAAFDDLHARMLAEVTCDAGYKDNVGRLMARVVLAGAADGDKAAIEKALGYGRPWQALVALGDIHYAAKSWPDAVKLYEEAIDDIRDVAANPKAPPRDVEEGIVKRALQARALAPVYVKTRKFRGKQTGLASPHFRNFSAVAVPVPIQFEYNSSALTPEGRFAVEDIYAYLQENPHRQLRLFGHTDPRGSERYNIRLSQDRAGSVATYLADLGYPFPIDVIG